MLWTWSKEALSLSSAIVMHILAWYECKLRLTSHYTLAVALHLAVFQVQVFRLSKRVAGRGATKLGRRTARALPLIA